MKKERLTKEDKIILKKKGFNSSHFLIVLVVLGLWFFYTYYFRESYPEHNGSSYVLELLMVTLAGVLVTGMFIASKTEFYSGYKLVFVGHITSKKTVDNDGIDYYFFMNEEKFTVSKDDYEKFERGQKVRVEISSILKQTIRVSATN